jgi:hypothetical protein
MLACSISRIDFDKHIELIADANNLLHEHGQRVAIYGMENRLYTHHKLEARSPNWRENYRGKFPTDSVWAGVKVARRYKQVVDMSVIVGDGGGTEYTHLEALDAGCGLILHSDWRTPDCEMDGYARFVGNGRELADMLLRDLPTYVADELFHAHDATRIAVEYEKVLA